MVRTVGEIAAAVCTSVFLVGRGDSRMHSLVLMLGAGIVTASPCLKPARWRKLVKDAIERLVA